eukprot:symbB.v1.2.031666.t1/scaffold3700.1/size51726/5
MPGQPLKEMFARMKALEPGLFEDKYYHDIYRDLPKDWRHLLKRIHWAEKKGIFSEESAGSFAGQEETLVPAVYHTQRLDTATICVGRSSSSDSTSSPLPDGYEYDYLEMLYVKDQEGRVVQVVPWESCGIYPAVFWTFSFQPPRGTSSLTPFAAFKLRGVWRGEAVEWDPTQGSEEMEWFANMTPELRREMTDPKLLEGQSKMEVESLPRAKREKELPVLWPENSWQGNVAKAKIWDQLQQDAFAASFNRLSEELGQRWSEVNIIPQLQTLLEHKNYLYRISAILSTRALAEVSSADFIDKHLVPMVVKLTNDPVPNVRFNAAKTILAMHQVCGKSTPASFNGQLVPCLYRLVQDEDPDVKFFAQKAISELGG